MRKPEEMMKMMLQDFALEFYSLSKLGEFGYMTIKDLNDFIDKFMQENGLNG